MPGTVGGEGMCCRQAHSIGAAARCVKAPLCPLARSMPAPLLQAAALSVPNAYGALLQQEGGVGLNAATSHDATK